MGKTKKDMNTRKQTKAAGQRKQTKESALEQLCRDNISMNESDNSSMLDSSEESFNSPVIAVKFPDFYRTFSLTSILLPT